ncbi:undecaprenyl-diphosphate phosphatase [Streptomyces mirabilis]|uniref:undecaprenyl-diphosphate phosphatase n=1 Tax=Streptomyces mirabilis TaxID=68239 RepID=UPI0033CE592D
MIGLHLATALALVVSFWRDWIRVIRGLSTSVTQWRIQTVDQRLARLIIMATIPVGVAGIALDKLFRTTLGRPVPTAIFLSSRCQ